MLGNIEGIVATRQNNDLEHTSNFSCHWNKSLVGHYEDTFAKDAHEHLSKRKWSIEEVSIVSLHKRKTNYFHFIDLCRFVFLCE